ncbi:MAG: EthD domain-containing protein [Acidimicrobiia bacterium]|nr:EthD domain-containing protein [Acidimicrobiia bacterium]
MIKLVFCLRRKPGMTREEFQRYWRDQHAPLVAERAEVLGIKRYVQVHTADLPDVHEALQARNGGSPEPFDGVAELWFDSTEVFASGDPARVQAVTDLLDDERRFIDLPNSPMWLAEEHLVVG